MKWKTIPATEIVEKLSITTNYVISHRPNEFTLTYRPEGRHEPLGRFYNLASAKASAETHNRIKKKNARSARNNNLSGR